VAPPRSSMRVTNSAGIVSPAISLERISDFGTSWISRMFSNEMDSGPRDALPFWNTCMRLPMCMRTVLSVTLVMNLAMFS
jgi:hypothetical protein